MSYLFTSESVSEGHPDKVADQISDSILDHFLAFDPDAKVACETMVTTDRVFLAGEVKSLTDINVKGVVRKVIEKIGYTKKEYGFDADSCTILSTLDEQSEDINRGVIQQDLNQGAGDQGIIFGYATTETENFMPLTLDLANRLVKELNVIRREGKVMTYLRPDAKSQVTVAYDNEGKPERIDAIVVSTWHDEFASEKEMADRIKDDVIHILIPRVKAQVSPEIQKLFRDDIKYFVNPTGKFVIGGPHGDAGLTGRKIIIDTYGGKGAHGGGAFSGKDPSKVDRSAAYAARHMAKNLVAAGIADELLVQVSYAIGVARPMGIYLNTFGTSKIRLKDNQIVEKIKDIFDMRPYAIIERLKLKNPIYSETAAYGHMGRKNETITKTFTSKDGRQKEMEVELFTWEKLDLVDQIKEIFQADFS